MSACFQLLSYVLAGVAAVLVASGLVGLVYAEVEGFDLLGSAAIVLFLAVVIRLVVAGHSSAFRRHVALIAVLAIWIAAPALLAVPIGLMADLGFTAAVFQAVSALTTTGALVTVDPDQLPRSVLFALCLISWFGGGLTIVMAVFVLGPIGAGGLPAPIGGHGGRRHVSNADVFPYVVLDFLPIYGGVTVAAVAALLLAGLPLFDAICLALSVISTGGFVPRSGGIATYASPAVETVLIVAMTVGATSILWQRQILERRWRAAREGSENFTVFAAVVVLAFVLSVILTEAGIADAFRRGAFLAASLVSTTGFEPAAGSLAALPTSLVAVVVLAGGASFSTAGGLKLFRVRAMAIQGVREVRRLIYPHGVRPARIGHQAYTIQLMKAVWAAFAVMMVTLAVTTILVAPVMDGFAASLWVALAALTNAGPIYGTGSYVLEAAWAPWKELAPWAHWVLIFAMVLGRVELVAALALLNLAFWRR